MLLLAMGEFASFAPANLLQRLPLFSNFRIPSRHILLAPLLGAACLAFVVRAFQDLPWSRDARRLVAIVCSVERVAAGRGESREPAPHLRAAAERR